MLSLFAAVCRSKPFRLLLPLVATALLACPQARAQGTFPSKPFHVVLPVPPGGLQDSLARAMGVELGRRWGQPVVIENRAGGNGIVSANSVAKAAPDAHTVWMGTVVQLSNDLIPGRSVPFDPAKDLVPVIALVEAGSVLVVWQQSPAKTLQELVSYARRNPGQLNYGSFGVGSLPHIDTIALANLTGMDVIHIPYKGGPEILQAILTGQVTFSIVGITATLPMIRDGRLRALAYGGTRRSQALPEVPTFPEAGIRGFTTGGWFGWFAPAGTPRPLLERIAADAGRVITAPEFRDKYVSAAGLEVTNAPPEAFAERVKADRASYAARLKGLGDVRID